MPKKKHSAINKLDFEQKEFLSKDNVYEFKIAHNEDPDAYVTRDSIILFHVNNEIRYISLFDYNKKFIGGSENIIRLQSGNAYDKSENEEKYKKLKPKKRINSAQLYEDFLKENPDF